MQRGDLPLWKSSMRVSEASGGDFANGWRLSPPQEFLQSAPGLVDLTAERPIAVDDCAELIDYSEIEKLFS